MADLREYHCIRQYDYRWDVSNVQITDLVKPSFRKWCEVEVRYIENDRLERDWDLTS